MKCTPTMTQGWLSEDNFPEPVLSPTMWFPGWATRSFIHWTISLALEHNFNKPFPALEMITTNVHFYPSSCPLWTFRIIRDHDGNTETPALSAFRWPSSVFEQDPHEIRMYIRWWACWPMPIVSTLGGRGWKIRSSRSCLATHKVQH